MIDNSGGVVDWYSGIAAEVARLLPQVDAGAFALAWRAGYQSAMRAVMERIAAGEGGFTLLDELHLGMLETVLARFGAEAIERDGKRQLNTAWHRLPAWPDAAGGLARLKGRYTICTLSNGNIGLLTELSKRAGLPWDCILSAEVFKAYKPDPRVYLGAAGVFDVAPGQVMLAAAHLDDLAAARACGLRTAHIERPHEFGPKGRQSAAPSPGSSSGDHLQARDIAHLADLLGC